MLQPIQAYELLAAGVVGVAFVVFVVVYFLRSYRMRRLEELKGDPVGRASAGDRAYNRIALARREADLLESQGTEVSRARQLIELANHSLDQRQNDRAYELAQSAHETLVKARREPRLRSAWDPTASPTPEPLASVPPMAPSPALNATPAPSPAVPKNRVEAQFELRLLEQDLAQAGSAAAGPNKEARELYVQGHAAFDKGNFADAFRLAIRGRRKVGATVESLGGSAAGQPPMVPGAGPLDPDRTAEATASAGRCAQCGHPLVAGDGYCRGCGAPTSNPCPKCGSPRRARDTFCGKCGAPAG